MPEFATFSTPISVTSTKDLPVTPATSTVHPSHDQSLWVQNFRFESLFNNPIAHIGLLCCASGFSFASKIAQSFTIFVVGYAAHSAFCFAQNFLRHLRFFLGYWLLGSLEALESLAEIKPQFSILNFQSKSFRAPLIAFNSP